VVVVVPELDELPEFVDVPEPVELPVFLTYVVLFD
jgi:hypothetical protein